MPRRPAQSTGPKTYASKQFTLDEIMRGIEKLQRRIAEVKALKEKGVRYDDQVVKNAELNIQETIREVFGEDSAEYDKHRYHDIWHGPMIMGDSKYSIQSKFDAGIPHSVTMLEGLIARLEEKRTDLTGDATQLVHATLKGFDLHPRIAMVVTDLYENGHYANAVLDGAIALINFVKERSGRHDLDGKKLMQDVLSVNNPILAFNDLSDQTDRDEQEGMMHLFEGTVMAVRNPRAHALFDHDPQRALEYIVLLSLLTKRLEESERIAPPEAERTP